MNLCFSCLIMCVFGFPTMDIKHIIKDVLRLNIQYMLHEDWAYFSYTEQYYIGDVFVYTSDDEEKGVLLELKGKGCRQMESYLLAQERSWYDFLMDCLVEGGIMKRLDLAINDRTGILNIPELIQKCKNDECISVFWTLFSLLCFRRDFPSARTQPQRNGNDHVYRLYEK